MFSSSPKTVLHRCLNGQVAKVLTQEMSLTKKDPQHREVTHHLLTNWPNEIQYSLNHTS